MAKPSGRPNVKPSLTISVDPDEALKAFLRGNDYDTPVRAQVEVMPQRLPPDSPLRQLDIPSFSTTVREEAAGATTTDDSGDDNLQLPSRLSRRHSFHDKRNLPLKRQTAKRLVAAAASVTRVAGHFLRLIRAPKLDVSPRRVDFGVCNRAQASRITLTLSNADAFRLARRRKEYFEVLCTTTAPCLLVEPASIRVRIPRPGTGSQADSTSGTEAEYSTTVSLRLDPALSAVPSTPIKAQLVLRHMPFTSAGDVVTNTHAGVVVGRCHVTA